MTHCVRISCTRLSFGTQNDPSQSGSYSELIYSPYCGESRGERSSSAPRLKRNFLRARAMTRFPGHSDWSLSSLQSTPEKRRPSSWLCQMHGEMPGSSQRSPHRLTLRVAVRLDERWDDEETHEQADQARLCHRASEQVAAPGEATISVPQDDEVERDVDHRREEGKGIECGATVRAGTQAEVG